MVNKYQWLIDLAGAFDAWRPFPRLFIAFYLHILYESFHWFTALEEPTTQQASLVGAIITAGAGWFGLYLNNNNKKQ